MAKSTFSAGLKVLSSTTALITFISVLQKQTLTIQGDEIRLVYILAPQFFHGGTHSFTISHGKIA
jgi:hypothetical protein